MSETRGFEGMTEEQIIETKKMLEVAEYVELALREKFDGGLVALRERATGRLLVIPVGSTDAKLAAAIDLEKTAGPLRGHFEATLAREVSDGQ